MKFFHISHTDLDGYGCQFISKKIFENGRFLNANYGIEIKVSLNIVLDEIRNGDEKEIFFFITDINLNSNEAKNLDRQINSLNNDGFKIKLQLLDHHATGERCANRYEWYYLDTSKSATKITYEYFQNNYEQFNNLCEKNFDILIEAINAVDIWLDDNQYFEFGKVCMTMIAKANEINNILFAEQNRDYRLTLLKNTLKYINKKNGNIKLDKKIYYLKKEYLKKEFENDTMDNLSSKYLVKMLNKKKEELTIYYKNHKGLLTFTLGGISIPANKFLKENEDYDFFIDISRRGKAGFRANGKLDVAKLAEKLANGGGHPNASGAAFDNWKETIKYEDVKYFIQEKLDNLN